uniref:SpoIID/LytB domain-containing protein n=1 Tax=Acetivibrio cellulolyticus TaxID=35830 RepID=UPI00030A4A8F|nr:SpoIID/LytB domain-containing protein [Acetivibrio cellulolyticus]
MVLKNLVITGLISCLLFLTNSVSYAVSTNQYLNFNIGNGSEVSVENREVANLIGEISTYLDKKQYDKFISLTSGDLNSSFSDLFLGPDSYEYRKKNIGLWNLNRFKTINYKQVSNDQVPRSSVNYNDYTEYAELVTYYVCCDITTKENNSDMCSGMNNFIFVFGKDNNGEYKLLQWSQHIIKEMQESNLASVCEIGALKNNIINGRLDGTALGSKKEQSWKYDDLAKIENDPFYCPMPSQIRVKIKGTGEISTVDFYYYIKNVLPNEWTALADPMESLKAGAMAVKMYGWYRCYNYKYYGMGFDVYDTTVDQVYKAGSEHERSTEAINAVAGIGIRNASGLIFETQYNAHDQKQHSGYISQIGANSLADKGYSWVDICNYYYSNSNKSTGNISSFDYYSIWGVKNKFELIMKALLD